MIHEILQAPHLPPLEKEFNRINNEVCTVLGAGIETVAQILRFIIYYIYRDRAVLCRLRAELSHLPNIHSSEAEVSLRQLE